MSNPNDLPSSLCPYEAHVDCGPWWVVCLILPILLLLCMFEVLKYLIKVIQVNADRRFSKRFKAVK